MKILLIEHNESHLLVLKRFIEDIGIFQYEKTANYQQAIAIMGSYSPDLIICNPNIFEQSKINSLLKKATIMRIPLLWTIPAYTTTRTKIHLQYSLNYC